jgi:glycosyltransferase involved in cell wall biosynthesis
MAALPTKIISMTTPLTASHKKVVFVSPYLPKHFGGGEKYILDCARIAAERYTSLVAIPGAHTDHELTQFKKKYEHFLRQSLENVTFINTPLFTSTSFLTKLNWTRQFDAVYYQSDGSLFWSLARKNVLHLQIPFTQPIANPLNRMKLWIWNPKNSNSAFTKNVIEKSWRTKIDVVHHPMVDQSEIPALPRLLKHKQPLILSVGRFFTDLHSKRQDVLVESFKTLLKERPDLAKTWKLVIIGSVENEKYAASVREAAAGLPIEVLHDVTRKELLKWYEKASFYWHVAGYGVNQLHHPEKVEHFGISTVEAMAHAAVPIVINKGGQPEVLGGNLTDLLINDSTELIKTTQRLIDHEAEFQCDQQAAYQRAKLFDGQQFRQKLWSMLD